MLLRCIVMGATVLAFAGTAQAQSSPPAAGESQSPCMAGFTSLRQELDRAFEAARAGVAAKLAAPEMCRRLTLLADANDKMTEAVEEKGVACGVPPTTLKEMKANHVKITDYKNRACKAAQAHSSPPAADEPPSLQSCTTELRSLQQEVFKNYETLPGGLARKVTAPETCRLLTRLTDAQNKLIAYLEEKGLACGLFPKSLDSTKAINIKTTGFKKQICEAAARQQQPQRPRLPRPVPPGPWLLQPEPPGSPLREL